MAGINIGQTIKKLKKIKENHINEKDKQVLDMAIRGLLAYNAYKAENKKIFEWIKCKRKNGSEFLKLVYYRYESDGWVEIGRFNMTKDEAVNNEWSIDEVFGELK